MCGRFTLRSSPSDLFEVFEVVRAMEMEPRYNIAPTQPVAVVRATPEGRQLDLLRWGLIPWWADEPSIGNRMINARAESVATKAGFRDAFRERRCLIPADGFYEWKKTGGRKKQPFLFERRDGRPFGFAGLWEKWKRGEPPIESCTIITGEPNDLAAEVHDRMPVILEEEAYERWLDPTASPDELQSLLVPYPADQMTMRPVSAAVNNARNETPECVELPQETPSLPFGEGE